jgi:hypothetical protein
VREHQALLEKYDPHPDPGMMDGLVECARHRADRHFNVTIRAQLLRLRYCSDQPMSYDDMGAAIGKASAYVRNLVVDTLDTIAFFMDTADRHRYHVQYPQDRNRLAFAIHNTQQDAGQ